MTLLTGRDLKGEGTSFLPNTPEHQLWLAVHEAVHASRGQRRTINRGMDAIKELIHRHGLPTFRMIARQKGYNTEVSA